MTFVVGLDGGHRCVPAAEQWLQTVLVALGRSAVRVACTHVAARPFPHVALSLALDEAVPRHLLPRRAAAVIALKDVPPVVANRDVGSKLVTAAAHAASDHARGVAGRAVIFPGVERLTGLLRIEEVLAISAVERVTVLDRAPLGTSEAPVEAKLDTRGYVRPHWCEGRLTLLVRPAADGHLVPFEAPP